MHCLSRMWWKPNVTQTIFDLHLSGICPSVSVWSRILQHRHTHPAWVLLVYWGYVSVYLSVCTFSCLWVYLLLVIPWMCICTFVCFAPFLDHMSLTVLDIWWPYIYCGSLTELHKPWELLLCRLLWCLWLYIHVCAHVCVCDGERERDDLRFGADVFTAWVQLCDVFSQQDGYIQVVFSVLFSFLGLLCSRWFRFLSQLKIRSVGVGSCAS